MRRIAGRAKASGSPCERSRGWLSPGGRWGQDPPPQRSGTGLGCTSARPAPCAPAAPSSRLPPVSVLPRSSLGITSIPALGPSPEHPRCSPLLRSARSPPCPHSPLAAQAGRQIPFRPHTPRQGNNHEVVWQPWDKNPVSA